MEYNRYYIVRTKLRADGDVDFESKEVYSLANAYNTYYTYKASAFTDATYPKIGICILNAEMRQLESCCVTTQYTAPTTEESTNAD